VVNKLEGKAVEEVASGVNKLDDFITAAVEQAPATPQAAATEVAAVVAAETVGSVEAVGTPVKTWEEGQEYWIAEQEIA
jgi:NADPH:quinone reductase-like Zn-dependent oxidoreductase